MLAGPLDSRITLRRASLTTNALGEEIPTWRDLASVWARRDWSPGGEQLTTQELGSTVSASFRIRWSSRLRDLNPRDRVLASGREWDIMSVIEIGRREGLEITAQARSD